MAYYYGMNLCIYFLIISIGKVLNISEIKFASSKFQNAADEPSVEQSAAPVNLLAADARQNRKEEEEMLQHAEDENKAGEEKQQREVHRERMELIIFQ